MGGRTSRDKGKRGERELVNLLKAQGWEAERNWAEQSEKGGSGVDVESSKDRKAVAWQVKFAKNVNAARALFEVLGSPGPRGAPDYTARVAATRIVPAKPKAYDGWAITMTLEDFLNLLEGRGRAGG